MQAQNIDRDWRFGLGTADFYGMVRGENKGIAVNLPHDYMISSDVTSDAPAGPASGYYTAGVAYYSKRLWIPAEWEQKKVYLRFDGVMMNATVEINGTRAALHHYGYSPFVVDITPYLYCGRENIMVVTVNPSMQPNSRWYSGAGIFRSVELLHGPAVHIESDGIYAYTKRIEEHKDEASGTTAYVQAEVTVCNSTGADQIAEVEVSLVEEAGGRRAVSRSARIQIDANSCQTAHIAMTVENALLWDAQNPNLYRIEAKVTALSVFRTHLVESEEKTEDADSVLFGIRTVTADRDWEEMTEAFTNGLDIVGYNYLEDKYEQDHVLYPDRVMLGSENFPKEIGKHWPMVMRTPYVIGDFTWTAVDYIGEAGIGKSVFRDPEEPKLDSWAWELSSNASWFPYRLANDADIDINGFILPQGRYRSTGRIRLCLSDHGGELYFRKVYHLPGPRLRDPSQRLRARRGGVHRNEP